MRVLIAYNAAEDGYTPDFIMSLYNLIQAMAPEHMKGGGRKKKKKISSKLKKIRKDHPDFVS